MKDRIKQIRAQNNLTQAKFAECLGLSQNYIAQVEIGKKDLGDRAIRDICREFGVSETWLRTGAGEMTAPKSREQEMAQLFRTLMADRPESFRSSLITTLLRFDPDGPEWEILERIYDGIAEEANRTSKSE